MSKYFKVKIGYGADDYISIDDSELRVALKAQATGQVAVFKNGSVSGNHIMSILPDWNRVMGYNRDYKLTGEDYLYIGEDTQDEYRDLIETTTNEIKGINPQKNTELIDDAKTLLDKFKIK